MKSFLFEGDLLCLDCQKKLKIINRRFFRNGKPVYIVLEYSEETERLLDRLIRFQYPPAAMIFADCLKECRTFLRHYPLFFADYQPVSPQDPAWLMLEGCTAYSLNERPEKYRIFSCQGMTLQEADLFLKDPGCSGVCMLMSKETAPGWYDRLKCCFHRG